MRGRPLEGRDCPNRPFAQPRPTPPRLLRPDPKLLDNRPPFLGIGFYKCAECLRSLTLASKSLESEIDKPSLHRRIGQCLDGCHTELVDDILRRSFGRGKPEQGGGSHFAKGRDVG